MTISEADRHQLLTALQSAIGKEAAMTLAAHLPPVGWADVATKQDLANLQAVMDHRFAAIDHRFAAMEDRIAATRAEIETTLHKELGGLHKELGGLHHEMAASQRLLFFSILGAAAANAGLVLAAIQGLG